MITLSNGYLFDFKGKRFYYFVHEDGDNSLYLDGKAGMFHHPEPIPSPVVIMRWLSKERDKANREFLIGVLESI